jgi:hypothetical protein
MGNDASYYQAYAAFYEEAEMLFRSALSLSPEHDGALRNLNSVQKNWRLRAQGQNQNLKTAIESSALPVHQQEQGDNVSLIMQNLETNRIDRTSPTETKLEGDSSDMSNSLGMTKGEAEGGESSPFTPRENDSKSPHCSGGKDENVGQRWLTIGIPTVPRKNNPDYLMRTVKAITNQLPTRPDEALYCRVMVVVMNNRPGTHSQFEDVKSLVEGGPYSPYFMFLEAGVEDTDGFKEPINRPDLPNAKVPNSSGIMGE